MIKIGTYAQIVSTTKVMCDETLGWPPARKIDISQDARGSVIITAADDSTVRRYVVDADGKIKTE